MIILIVNPLFRFDGDTLTTFETKIGLGPLYLAAVAMKLGYKVHIINISKFDYLCLLKKINPDIVMVTCMIEQQKAAFEILKQTKEFNKKIITILGGYFPTFLYEKILKNFHSIIDFICVGEGEEFLQTFLEEIKKDKPEYKKIPGMAYYKNEKVFLNNPKFVKNLDKLPFPARFLLRKKVPIIISSRGCFHDCRFCAIKNFYKRTIRFRSLENFIEELKVMEDKKYNEISIVDDNFVISGNRLKELKELLCKKKLKLHLNIMLRADQIRSIKFCKDLNLLNFRKIKFGLQSITPEFHKFMHTELNKKDLNKFFNNLKFIEKSEIHLFYIMNSGNKNERVVDIIKNNEFLIKKIKTLRNKCKLKIVVDPFILGPSPGTDIKKYFITNCYFYHKYNIKKLENWPRYKYNDLNEKKLKNIYKEFIFQLSNEGLFNESKNIFSFFFNLFCKFITSSLSFKAKILMIIESTGFILIGRNVEKIKYYIKEKYL
ncbi:MAG: B12-binding domain-containing radical SAM protein [Candidatus Woesearchaeota archaeon]